MPQDKGEPKPQQKPAPVKSPAAFSSSLDDDSFAWTPEIELVSDQDSFQALVVNEKDMLKTAAEELNQAMISKGSKIDAPMALVTT